MNISGKISLYYNDEYENFSGSFYNKDKDGEIINFYYSVKFSKDAGLPEIDNRNVAVIEIKDAFFSCFETKKGEIKLQLVVLDFENSSFDKKSTARKTPPKKK